MIPTIQQLVSAKQKLGIIYPQFPKELRSSEANFGNTGESPVPEQLDRAQG